MKRYLCTLLTVAVVMTLLSPFSMSSYGATEFSSPSTEHRTTVPTSGGNRTVTWIEIDLSVGYEVRGMSAQDTFDRSSATLAEFAAAAPNLGEDTIIFPVNFFITATFEIVGAIYSQGRVVSSAPQPWLSWGVGFTECNQMSLFSGRLSGNYVYGYHWADGRLPYTTAFNAYPHLIRDGERLDIQPGPGVTESWLNGLVRRAFMGQRADGTFVVGVTDGTNIHQLQDIAEYFNLVNATNIDGGASASIWRNGATVVAPGRPLASVMVITGSPGHAEPPTQPPAHPPAPPIDGLPFVDLTPGHWSIPAIRYVYEHGIMTGLPGYRFEPQTGLSRAMIATILHRFEGQPSVSFRPLFSDVAAGAWYANPTIWAYDANVVQGVGGGLFAPQQQLTREQLAAMMFRYARNKGLDVTIPANVTSPFSDTHAVSGWATEYIQWAIYNEFFTTITRDGTLLNPTTAASRAETAHVIYRFSHFIER